MNKQQMIDAFMRSFWDKMVEIHGNDDNETFEEFCEGDQYQEVAANFGDILYSALSPHLEAQQREIERLREALAKLNPYHPAIKQALAGEEVKDA